MQVTDSVGSPSHFFQGQTVPCLPLTGTHCTLVLDQRTLVAITYNPARFTKRSDPNADPLEIASHQNHDEIQRPLDAGKKKNLEAYIRYLYRTRWSDGSRQQLGFAPPISLWTPDHMEYFSMNPGGWKPGIPAMLSVPIGSRFIAFDGDTQLSARHRLMRDYPETATDPVAVTLIHGESVEWAKTAFSHVNRYGVKVSKELALERDDSDVWAGLARDVATLAQECDGPALKVAMTFGSIRAYYNGLACAKSKIPIPDEELDAIRDDCLDYYKAVFSTITACVRKMVDEDATEPDWGVAASQVLMIGFGVVGNRLRRHATKYKLSDVLEALRTVDWGYGEHWLEIACQRSARKGSESFIKLNSNRTWDMIADALIDPTCRPYQKIRHLKTRAAS